jgi:hypothetical protein
MSVSGTILAATVPDERMCQTNTGKIAVIWFAYALWQLFQQASGFAQRRRMLFAERFSRDRQ